MEHYIVYSGKRTALAAMQKGYIDTLMPWVNDPRATEGVRITPPVSLEVEQSWYDSLATRKADTVFAILVRESEESSDWRYVGNTSLINSAWPHGYATSGTFIGDSSVHKKGHGTEAKLFLLYHAFYVLGLRKVLSELKAFNGNSLGHLRKCGYYVTGVSKEHFFHNGEFVDKIMLEVFRKDFDPIWERYQATGGLPRLSQSQKEIMQRHMTST